MSAKFLVLGGKNGLLGRALCEVLRGSGQMPLALGSADLDLAAPDAPKALAALIDREEPTCIFNAVGYTNVEQAEAEPEAARLLNRSVKALAQQYGADYVSIPYTSIANDGHPTVCGHKYIARQILKAVRK